MAGWFRRLKLNQKFTLVIFCVVLVPLVLLTVVLLENVRSVITEEKVAALENSLEQTRVDVDKAAEMCNMTTQVLVNSPNLRSYLLRAKAGDSFTEAELIAFYRSDIASFERMVNSNPYLYQARIYYPREDLPEYMPILYHESRMDRLAWAEGWDAGAPEEQAGGWQFDYTDDAFLAEVRVPTRHVMSLVTPIEDYGEGRLGVLEVAIRMDGLLPGLYESEVGETSCLVTGDGAHWYTGEDREDFWQREGPGLLALISENGGAPLQTKVDGEQVWVAAARLPQLDGVYLTVSSLGDAGGTMALRRNLILLGMAGTLVLVAVLVNAIVKAMLRRLYRVFATIAQVQKGDLSVRSAHLGEDEVGSLGAQVNLMLDRIETLMQENLSRQLLAKNSQIRALQSQINAHFIYNVLESIKMMAEVEGRYEISDAITSLGRLLRYSMNLSGDFVTLADELANVRNYLALINLRFDYQVDLEEEVPPGLLHHRVPKLILQPIVENAVVHGIEPLAKDSRITLAVGEEAGGITLAVTDRGRGMDEGELAALTRRLADPVEAGSEGGIGLKNVQDRIRMACGEDWGLTVDSRPGRTVVTIRLPGEDIRQTSA